jgi:hypothetical protein
VHHLHQRPSLQRTSASRLKMYGANGSISEEALRHTVRASSYANAITVRSLRPDLG